MSEVVPCHHPAHGTNFDKVEREAGHYDLPILQCALWVVCALMAYSTVASAFMTFAKPIADLIQGCEALIPLSSTHRLQ